MKSIVVAMGIFLALVSGAEARAKHQRTYQVDPGCNIIFPCEGVKTSARGERIARQVGFGAPVKTYTPRTERRTKVRVVRQAPVHLATQQFSFGAPSNPIVNTVSAVGRGVVSMLPHPSGCPGRAFCGCGAAVEVFGTPRRDLWLASNWFKFPRAAPAPGMVAVRNHHVFVLKQQTSGGWLVADYNSGGHASRLHVRSLGGYTIVNPRG